MSSTATIREWRREPKHERWQTPPTISRRIYRVTSVHLEPRNNVHWSNVHEERDVAAIFARLNREWRAEVRFVSSTTKRVLHPAYQQIIGLGPAAIPYILRELESRGGHWAWALTAIVREDPVPADAAGDVARITNAWLEWGRREGYLER